MRKYIVMILMLTFCIILHAERKPIEGGYPIANFAMTVNVAENGDMYGQILQNKGKLGGWLINRGAIELAVEKNGKVEKLSQFKDTKVRRMFPMVEAEYKKSDLLTSNISLKTFSPLAETELETSSLPVLK